MERLTEENPYWLGEEFWTSVREPDEDEIDQVYERLWHYENTGLTPEQVRELADAGKQGLLLRMPCKVGDTVYVLAECEKIRSVLDGDYDNATGYYCPYELSGMCPHDTDSCENVESVTTVFEDTVKAVWIEETGLEIITENTNVMGMIGQCIFLARVEAETKLAEMEGSHEIS